MSNEDMSELFNKFSNMINEGNIPDDVKNLLSSVTSSNNNSESSNTEDSNRSSNKNTSTTSSIDFETILKMKSIMDKLNNTDDPRANLLLSLKPYLKKSRKDKVDKYVKIFGMTKVLETFSNSGGDISK